MLKKRFHSPSQVLSVAKQSYKNSDSAVFEAFEISKLFAKPSIRIISSLDELTSSSAHVAMSLQSTLLHSH